MKPDYEAQFQRFYYDLYTLSYCLAYSEKAQEERRQIKDGVSVSRKKVLSAKLEA